MNEITRSISYNQLDYVLLDKSLRDRSFVTSYHNFISDHKSITARIGWDGNSFTDKMRMKLTFDSESHMKSKSVEESVSETSSSSDSSHESDCKSPMNIVGDSNPKFRRKFLNPDFSTCSKEWNFAT